MFPIEVYRACAACLKTHTNDFTPEILLVLGSGLDFLAGQVEGAVTVPFAEIPHFSEATVAGHAGALTFGTLAGRRVMLMRGRMHMYEGNSPEQSALAVGVAKQMGASMLFITNASGGIRLSFTAGDIMLITDQIKLYAATPLWGKNCDELGPRFPDMTHAYSERLQAVARRAAAEAGVSLQEGVYFYAPGPQYETPAEIRAMRLLGGDAVGMSTVNEAIAAAHCGLETLGLALITNMAAGVTDQKSSHADVMDAAAQAQERFTRLVLRALALA